MAATTVPHFTFVPRAWEVVVDGVFRGIVEYHSYMHPGLQFCAKHAGRAIFEATKEEAARQLLAALEAEPR